MENEDETITILLNGVAIDTYIDDNGVQRFIPNAALNFMFENDQLDMNQLFAAFTAGEFTLDAYQEFYCMMGFSVGGFEEVFGEGSGIASETGQPCVILNPLEGHGQTIQ